MNARWRRWAMRFDGLLVLLAMSLLLADRAWARLGGGESFSTGTGGGGFEGGGGDGDILFFLIWLAIHYPAIGVPLLLGAVTIFLVKHVMGGNDRDRQLFDSLHHVPGQARGGLASRPAADAVAPLRASDPGFSLPALQDFLQLLHRRATEAAVRDDFSALGAYVTPAARQTLRTLQSGVNEVTDLVTAGVQPLRVSHEGEYHQLLVRFETSRRELTAQGERRIYLRERWTFRRLATAVSQAPEDMLRMGCPSCGAAGETTDLGACVRCGTPIDKGQLQWQVADAELEIRRRPIPPPTPNRATGDEPSVHQPTVIDPDLGTQTRALLGRHPDFRFPDFEKHVHAVYHELQGAWSEGRWERARPHVTDPMFQTLRFWMAQRAEHGLRNRLEQVRLDRVQVVRIELDAWYEAITVRIWGAMRDWVEDGQGKVYSGNKEQVRAFSEYWTFLRAAGSGGSASPDPLQCPSCNAPLDNVNQAGVCGYCDTKITSGRFDWVLSRIDQAEVYR